METIYSAAGKQVANASGQDSAAFGKWASCQAVTALAWRLFQRDISAKYRQSLLGVLWAIITPLFLVAVLFVLNRSGIIQIGEMDLPFPVFALLGISLWGVFATGVSASTESLIGAGRTILKVNFPRSALILAASWRGIFELLVRLPLVGAVCLYYQVYPDPAGLLVAAAVVVPLYVITLACGLVLSVIGVVLRDISHVLPIALTLLMFLSPVLYPIAPDSMLGRVNVFNPVGQFVLVARDAFLGTFRLGPTFWLSCLASAALLLIACRLFNVAQRHIIERV